MIFFTENNYKAIEEGDKIIDENIIYDIKNILGYGSFGAVYKSTTSVGRDIAIKIIHKRILFRQQAASLIENEILVHLSIKHNNIINLEKMFQDSNGIYLIMELCYCSLYNIIYENAENPFDNIFNPMKQIVNGLMYLKENLIVHRDIKPSNILINYDGIIKIADFGESKKLNSINDVILDNEDNKNSNMEVIRGTKLYLSPQVIMGEEYSFETDVWALGIVFCELLFQKNPFAGIHYVGYIRNVYKQNIQYPSDLKSEYKQLIHKMFIQDRLERISLYDLLIELDKI